MKTCAQCGATGTALSRKRLATYNDTVLLMPVILVNSVDQWNCANCGHELNVIANQEGLIAAVAVCRILLPRKLHGAEIRLLRKTMGLKSLELAKKLAVQPETMSRWETGTDVIGAQAERTLRILVAVSLQAKAPAIDINLPDLMNMEVNPVMDEDVEQLCLEAVRVKTDKKKETQYDKMLEAA